jgi:ribosomal protein L40E
MISCPQCNTNNHYVAKKCRTCGAKLNKVREKESLSQRAKEQIDSYATISEAASSANPGNQYSSEDAPLGQTPAEREELAVFVGKNAAYYLKRWDKMMHTGSLASWNWAAFLFSPLWLFYRKMYLSGIIYLIATILLSKYLVFQIIFAVAIGISGNFIYLQHARGKILAVKAIFHVPANQKKIIAKAGGTSWGMVIGLLVVFGIFLVVS